MAHYTIIRNIQSLALCCLLAITVGCGSGTEGVNTKIKGKVTYQGAPVGEGSVSLVNEAGDAGGQANLNPDGTFEIAKRLPVGKYSVAVVPPLVDLPATGTSSPGKVTKEVPNIPLQYRSNSTSKIQVEIAAGDNELKVEMQ